MDAGVDRPDWSHRGFLASGMTPAPLFLFLFRLTFFPPSNFARVFRFCRFCFWVSDPDSSSPCFWRGGDSSRFSLFVFFFFCASHVSSFPSRHYLGGFTCVVRAYFCVSFLFFFFLLFLFLGYSFPSSLLWFSFLLFANNARSPATTFMRVASSPALCDCCSYRLPLICCAPMFSLAACASAARTASPRVGHRRENPRR